MSSVCVCYSSHPTAESWTQWFKLDLRFCLGALFNLQQDQLFECCSLDSTIVTGGRSRDYALRRSPVPLKQIARIITVFVGIPIDLLLLGWSTLNIPTPNVLIGRDRKSTLFVHHAAEIANCPHWLALGRNMKSVPPQSSSPLSITRFFSDLTVSQVWKTPHPNHYPRRYLTGGWDVLAVGCVQNGVDIKSTSIRPLGASDSLATPVISMLSSAENRGPSSNTQAG